MRSNYRPKKKEKPQLLYDAYGMRIQNNRFSNKLKHFLLFCLLPYVAVNGLILLLVTAGPKVEIQVADTNDYRTTQVQFTVKSLLPLKSLTANIESVDVPFEKNGSSYTATVNMNGTFYVAATSLNGMEASNYADVSVLDATPPAINEGDCDISGGDLSFVITDSQSGVNFDSIYGIYDGTKEVRPTSYDRETGLVVIPLYTDSIQIHAEDMVGNAMSGTISASTDYTGALNTPEEETDGAAAEEDADSAAAEEE